MGTIIVLLPDAEGSVVSHLCQCFANGAFSPDGCCILLGLASCVFALMLLR